ncbi:MAG TPA: terpene utilization protein AtuA, partial [Gammaproteobacteria bacterium]|nr:terpene utilization protein AtuA [Gammaproteobacteria bacterium]
MFNKTIRIGGASGAWGDSQEGPAQLVHKGDIDYLVFDYLAEITMSILAKAYAKSDQLGYATDFVTSAMKPLIKDIAKKKIKVIANAGGVNLKACQAALQKVADEAGVTLRVGIIEGDNLLDRADEFRAAGVTEMGTGKALPENVMSINAYLGAL